MKRQIQEAAEEKWRETEKKIQQALFDYIVAGKPLYIPEYRNKLFAKYQDVPNFKKHSLNNGENIFYHFEQ